MRLFLSAGPRPHAAGMSRRRLVRGATMTAVALGALLVAPQAADAACGTIYNPCGGDPAGAVVDTHDRPVVGATVVLLRATGPGSQAFVPVIPGSDVLSAATPDNPQTTANDGRFGWDVAAGTYRVAAGRAGCTAATGVSPVAVSAPVAVPPGTTTLRLVLRCR